MSPTWTSAGVAPSAPVGLPSNGSGRPGEVPDPGSAAPAPPGNPWDERYGAVAVLVLLWASVILPNVVQSYTAPKYRESTTDEVEFSRLAGVTSTAITLLLLVLLAVLVVRRLPHLPGDRHLALVLMILPWAWQVGRDEFVGTPLRQGGLIYPLVVFVIWALRPRLRDLWALGYLVAATAAISLAMGALTPGKGTLVHLAGDAVTPDKQILPWGILIGPLTDGNPLGQFLSLGAPAVLLIPRRSARVIGLLMVALAVLWTSNRSSLIGLAVGGLLALGLRYLPAAMRRYTVVGTVLAGAAVVAYLPLTVASDSAFTNRGYIWRSSLEHWSEHVWLGLGSQWYAQSAQFADSIGATAFHGHNQFVQALVLGGLVNGALTLLMIVMLAYYAGRWASEQSVSAPAVLMAMLMVSSCFEVTLSLVHRSFLLPIVMLPMAYIAFGEELRGPAAARRTEKERPPTPWLASPTWTIEERREDPEKFTVTDEDLWADGGWRANAARRTGAR